MRVGQFGRFCSARVYKDDFAASLLDRFQAVFHPCGRHQTAIRSQRIGSQDEHKLGVVYVGDGDEELVAEHEVGGVVVGQLVYGGGGEPVGGAQGAHKGGRKEHCARVVDIGVALIDGQRGRAMRRLHPLDACYRFGEGFVPRDGFPVASGRAPHGLAQTVGVFVHILQRRCFGANVAMAKGVVFVPLNVQNALAIVLNDEAAHGLAQVTSAVVGLGIVHGLFYHKIQIRREKPTPPCNFSTLSVFSVLSVL